MSLREQFPWLQDSAALWEPAAMVGSMAASEIPSGLYGLLELARTRDPRMAAQAVEDLQQRMTYQPRTRAGQQGAGMLGQAIDTAMNWRGLMPTVSINDAIASAQTGASRILPPSAAALAEGILSVGLPAPARKLPMDEASRLARAADQGFDVSKRWYHGTSSAGVPVEFTDVTIGGVPVFKRGQPVDYSPHQFTDKPQARDYARANLQETFLVEENRLSEAAFARGQQGLIDEAVKIIDEQIAHYSDEWPELVPALERIKRRIDEGGNRLDFEGGESPQGIESFEPAAFNEGLYGRGVYMTDSPIIAGGGEGNEIADLGYASDPAFSRLLKRETELADEMKQVQTTLLQPDLDPQTREVLERWVTDNAGELAQMGQTVTGRPTVYPMTHRVQNPWLPDTQKVRRKDLPPHRLRELEDSLHAQGKNPKGKWPISDEALRVYMGHDWVNETLQEMGYDGIQHKGGAITGAPAHRVTVAFDPSQVRSRFATFDPERRTSRNILASGAGAALGLGVLADDEEPQGRLGM